MDFGLEQYHLWHRTVNTSKKLISDFQDLRIRDLLLKSTNFPPTYVTYYNPYIYI